MVNENLEKRIETEELIFTKYCEVIKGKQKKIELTAKIV